MTFDLPCKLRLYHAVLFIYSTTEFTDGSAILYGPTRPHQPNTGTGRVDHSALEAWPGCGSAKAADCRCHLFPRQGQSPKRITLSLPVFGYILTDRLRSPEVFRTQCWVSGPGVLGIKLPAQCRLLHPQNHFISVESKDWESHGRGKYSLLVVWAACVDLAGYTLLNVSVF